MARYRVQRDALRERMARSKRVVPHTLRSLAEQVEVSQALIGHLLTGKRETVDGAVAGRISEELDAPFGELFAPVDSPSGNRDADAEES